MSTGTTHMGGFVPAGVARPGVCPVANLVIPAIAASAYATPWLQETIGKQGFHRFMTDRPTQRPLERFP